jgi:hypothetical protein
MFFNKKPSEKQMEEIILNTAEGVYRQSLEDQVVSPQWVIEEVLQHFYSQRKLKPDARQLHASCVTVIALVSEGEMIKELCEYIEKNPGVAIPIDYFRRLREIAADFAEFASTHKGG